MKMSRQRKVSTRNTAAAPAWPRLQAKLAVGAPDDVHEREADRIADQVVRMSEPAGQRECVRCGETVQATEAPGGVPALTPAAESRIQSLRGGGSPLPEPARSYFEPRFGHDFSRVRAHADPEASSLARSISARAFTVGNDIFFGSGELAPENQAGRELLAHELTHVIQQGSAWPRVQRREVAGTRASAANVLLFPEMEKPAVKVDLLAHRRGGLVTDTSLRPRVSAILGPGSTLQGIAKRILPYYNSAKPSDNPAADSVAPSEDELARALLVYNRYYLGVPNMTGFKAGLRLPLPIEIDVKTGEWVVSPGLIRTWAQSFDAAWEPLLKQVPAALEVASAADLDKAVSDFKAERPSALAKGIALGARLLTNASDSDQFALRLFDSLDEGQAFDVALEMMNHLVNHQIQLLNSLGAGSAVLWRVLTILSLPPQGLSADRESWRQRALRMLPTETVLGLSAGKRPIQAFIFPGESSERALVLAGVHGSEQSGVEVVELLLAELRKGVRPYYTVVVVPKLFPDNYELAKREGSTETNRNLPAKGTSLDTARKEGAKKGKGPIDVLGKEILPENVMLIQLLERFRPSRVASVHATWDLKKPGVFTDPRSTTAETEKDRDLALEMAREARKGGANVAGNKLGSGDENVGFYQKDPPGTSLGGYGPREVAEGKATDRPAMTVITMEVGGNERSSALKDPAKLAARKQELASLRDVLLFLFLRVPRPKP
jgi:hypothetical protein